MEEQSMEKRKYRRVKNHFNIKIDRAKESSVERSPMLTTGKSINISANGILFRYDKLMELGEVIKVTFLKPNSFELFEGKARVVRTEINPDNRTYDIGIVFIELNQDDTNDLDYYVIDKEEF
jgi:c-di-GMP-binding flagellar brake protein YcgR